MLAAPLLPPERRPILAPRILRDLSGASTILQSPALSGTDREESCMHYGCPFLHRAATRSERRNPVVDIQMTEAASFAREIVGNYRHRTVQNEQAVNDLWAAWLVTVSSTITGSHPFSRPGTSLPRLHVLAERLSLDIFVKLALLVRESLVQRAF